jgi:hypothetical protein
MNNVLQAILAALPAVEQIALLFIHNKESQQKYSVITGTVNEVAPIAATLLAASTAPAASLTTTGH